MKWPRFLKNLGNSIFLLLKSDIQLIGFSGWPTCNRIPRFPFLYLSCSQIWLNPLVADHHFWSNMKKIEKKTPLMRRYLLYVGRQVPVCATLAAVSPCRLSLIKHRFSLFLACTHRHTHTYTHTHTLSLSLSLSLSLGCRYGFSIAMQESQAHKPFWFALSWKPWVVGNFFFSREVVSGRRRVCECWTQTRP